MIVFYYFFAVGGMFFDGMLDHPLYKETPPTGIFYADPCPKPSTIKDKTTPRMVGDTIFLNRLDGDGGQWVVLKSIYQ